MVYLQSHIFIVIMNYTFSPNDIIYLSLFRKAVELLFPSYRN